MVPVYIYHVYFETDPPTAEAILKKMFQFSFIQAHLSISYIIEDRDKIAELYRSENKTILNEQIINYSLWKEGYEALEFCLLEEISKKYIEIVITTFQKTLKGALIDTLVSMGGAVVEIE